MLKEIYQRQSIRKYKTKPVEQEKIEELEKEHRKLLLETVPEEFEIQHYAAMTVLRKNNYSFFRLRFEL